jgi:translation initiation factor 2-alpha kinase 4
MVRDREDERSFGYWTPSVSHVLPFVSDPLAMTDCQRCDVYVAAGAQVDLSVRMKLIAELWRSDISADLQYDDTRTLEEVTTECEEQSTP